jgi:hypothetical protein
MRPGGRGKKVKRIYRSVTALYAHTPAPLGKLCAYKIVVPKQEAEAVFYVWDLAPFNAFSKVADELGFQAIRLPDAPQQVPEESLELIPEEQKRALLEAWARERGLVLHPAKEQLPAKGRKKQQEQAS